MKRSAPRRSAGTGGGSLRVIVIMAAAFAATEASAQALPDTPQAFGAVLKTWARAATPRAACRGPARGPHRSSLASAALTECAVHLASLSKAITGVHATLVRDGVKISTPAATALAAGARRQRRSTIRRDGGAFHPSRRLRHAEGVIPSGPALMDYLGSNQHRRAEQALHLGADNVWCTSRAPVYSNLAIWRSGAMIEATGKGYAPYCREAVLAPLGLTATRANWRVLWSYAGWRMVPPDYLAFLDLFDADDRRLGAAAKDWMLDPSGKATSGEGWYGLGTYLRRDGRGVSIRHFGSWAYNTSGPNAASRTNFLTLAARQSDGTAWLVHVSPRPPRTDEERPGVELERALLDAYRGVKRWN